MTRAKTPRLPNVTIETGRFDKGTLGELVVYAVRFFDKVKVHARIVRVDSDGEPEYTTRGVAVDLEDVRAVIAALSEAATEAEALQAEGEASEGQPS